MRVSRSRHQTWTPDAWTCRAAAAADGDLSHYLVATGWFIHIGWDVVHHRIDRVVPRWYPQMCMVVDPLVVVGILLLAD